MPFSNAKNCKDQLPDWFRLDVASLKTEAAAAVLALAFLLTNFVTLKHSYDQVEKPTHVSKVVPKQWGFDKSYLSAKPTPWHSSSKNVNENIFNKKNHSGQFLISFGQAFVGLAEQHPKSAIGGLGLGWVRAFFLAAFFGSCLDWFILQAERKRNNTAKSSVLPPPVPNG